MLVAICQFRREPLTYPEGSTIALWILGFLSMGVYMILFLEGMARTTAAEGAIILATSPVLTALLAVAMKHERFSWG
ncbi:MAG TPA: DMT family transporter, partial [Ilumatobacteraceae bacterium]|nr:DMT family transporter [Ilumatobacteraceae bacterium]